jgi:hypothetical protein
MRSTRHRVRGQTTLRHVLIGAAVLLVLAFASMTERWWGGEAVAPEASPPVAATVAAAPAVSVAQPDAGSVVAPVPAPAPVVVAPPPPPKTAAQRAADQAAEEAREADWVETRREAIRIQQRLRAEANAQKAKAQQPKSQGETRCVDGQQMRRVENGWVQDGKC